MAHHHEKEEIILSNLIYLMDMGSYDGHTTLNVYSLNLKISVFLNNVQSNMTQAIFSIEHPEFEEEIIESVAGAGETINKALENIANNFYESILIPLLAGLNNIESEKLEVLLQKKLRLFKKYESDIICIGKKESMHTHENSLYDIVKDKISQYLGTKKVYMIKIFASFSVNKYICEVRINGVIIPELTKLVEDYAKTWVNMGGYYAEKQCIFFIQDDSTYEICPYTRKEAIENALKFIELFESGKEYDAIYSDMENIGKTKDLSTELFFLIPEIYCEVIINNVKYNDLILIMKDNNDSELIHTTQMRVYNYIKEAIYTHLDKNHPSDEKIFNVISLSARYLSIHNALIDGKSEFEELKNIYLTLPVDKNYKLF